ncbi:hypothetical protein [Caulobacter sp. NIBR1757]|uniref:hypothetical protein n=1 Tax=Caulobacter sp. NIBR1757 TaxID=3016000 RepID=UPI0022F00551|nr:hypothetical protein [Caulobacter sp. NIBR1757]WGM40593.1 hypothetical protein AMEJIAPC_03538 [Caulobacter sp. NIBR1757]
MKRLIAGACALALLAPTAALAQVQTITAKPGTVGSDGRKVKDKDGRLCKVLVVTGSRMPTKKVCKTAEEWDRQSDDAKRELEMQIRLNSTVNKIQNASGGR